jgi:hypothetical protein
MADSEPLARWKENPFFLLGLTPDVSQLEAERHGRKLLAQLELGVSSALIAQTPLGPVVRTADNVRRALAALQNPQERRMHALWAKLPATASAEGPASPVSTGADAMEAVGWPGL